MASYTDQQVQTMQQALTRIQRELHKITKVLGSGTPNDSSSTPNPSTQKKAPSPQHLYQGAFDGQAVVSKDKTIDILSKHAGYLSKAKLIPGDVIKVKTFEQGREQLEVVEKVERETREVRLYNNKKTDEIVAVDSDKNIFLLNQAAVKYYKGQPGDHAKIVCNPDHNSKYAALVSVTKHSST